MEYTGFGQLFIKKLWLDVMTVQSYHPMSRVSNLLERFVACHFKYLQLLDLLPSLQSSLQPNNSTVKAVLGVLSDLLEAVDSGDVAAEAPEANLKWRGTISSAKRQKNFLLCPPLFCSVPLVWEALCTPGGGGTKMCSYSSLQHISRPFRRQCC